MYEKPDLTQIGKAPEVILGYFPPGPDIDGNWMPYIQEFAPESETESDGPIVP